MISSWLVCCLGLPSCDYFLWGYLKVQVFKHRLQITDELKHFIHHEIAVIWVAVIRQLLLNFRMKLQEWIAYEGKHMDNLIFKNKAMTITKQNCSFYLENQILSRIYVDFFYLHAKPKRWFWQILYNYTVYLSPLNYILKTLHIPSVNILLLKYCTVYN